MNKIKNLFSDLLTVWANELSNILHDKGLRMMLILVPLCYPIIYSWIYNNERISEVPVVAVDKSHTSLSREYLRKCDATPDVKIIAYAGSIEEAREAGHERKSEGIIEIPSGFSSALNSMKQANVNVYCNMNGMLYYKAIIAAANDVALSMGKDLQVKMLGNTTKRQDEISTAPITYDYVPMFNPTGGYASFILPAVLALIIQQTLLLGIGMSTGTNHERKKRGLLKPLGLKEEGTVRIVFGKALAYAFIYSFINLWLLIIVPHLFHFTQLPNASALIAFAIPYTFACIFFAMTVSIIVRSREAVMLLIVFTSIPLLFISGVSWPGSNIPSFWKALSGIVPSTFGINAFIRINTMGALLEDVILEYKALWIQVVVYLFTACMAYRKTKSI